MSKHRSLKNILAWKIRRQFIARPLKYGEDVGLDEPVVVAGLFSTASGLGRAARGTFDALRELGVKCQALDLSPVFGVSDLTCTYPTIKQIPHSRTGTLIIHLNGPELLDGLYAMRMFRPKRWRVIGYWSWELPELPDSWKLPSNFLTEIWTLSDYCKRAIEQKTNIPVRVVPPYLNTKAQETHHPTSRESSNTCLILADGRSSFARKNVIGSIEIFSKAFADRSNWNLIVKLQNLDVESLMARSLEHISLADQRISVVSKKLSDEETWAMINSADIVLSAHRAEGFGLHLAEGMLLGKLVVATDWSGNTDFMTSNNSLPIATKFTPISDEYGVYDTHGNQKWAEPDIKRASEDLADLLQSPNQLELVCDQARVDIRKHCSVENYRTALFANS